MRIRERTAETLLVQSQSLVEDLPATRAALHEGLISYRHAQAMRRFLRLRDEACRFPGCNRSARRAEIDRSYDWALLGETAHDNLTHLGKPDHALTTRTWWTLAPQPGGILTWTSPTGRDFITEPGTVLPTGPLAGPNANLPDDPPF